MKELFKKKEARVVLWVAVVIVVALFFWLTMPKFASITEPNDNVNNTLQPSANTPAGNTNQPAATAPAKKPATKPPVGFTEKKAPHFVSASIANNSTLTAVPTVLKLTFDANVLKTNESFITVKKDDITSAILNTSTVDGKTMSVNLNTNVTDGDYYVYYVACFADTGCKDGRLGYHVKLP